jgi:hypothetical protein
LELEHPSTCTLNTNKRRKRKKDRLSKRNSSS